MLTVLQQLCAKSTLLQEAGGRGEKMVKSIFFLKSMLSLASKKNLHGIIL